MRPRKHRHIQVEPKIRFFKPQGDNIQKNETIILSDEELEALRLKNLENLDQEHAAHQMGVSQSTFQRILQKLYRKIAVALIEGRAISIESEKKNIECWECQAQSDKLNESDMICRPCEKKKSIRKE